MHDRTRRQVCRMAFVALGVLPRREFWAGPDGAMASRISRLRAELSRAVGLQVTCTALSYPRPGIVLIRASNFPDPETAAPLARMRFLESGGSGTTSAWVASQPELDAVQLRDFWQLVQPAIPRSKRHGGNDPSLRRGGDARLARWIANAHRRPRATFDARASGGPRTATMSFRIAGIDMPEPVKLQVTREREDSGDANPNGPRLKTTLELHTSGAALPCAMLAVPLGVANRLGPAANSADRFGRPRPPTAGKESCRANSLMSICKAS